MFSLDDCFYFFISFFLIFFNTDIVNEQVPLL